MEQAKDRPFKVSKGKSYLQPEKFFLPWEVLVCRLVGGSCSPKMVFEDDIAFDPWKNTKGEKAGSIFLAKLMKRTP